jgi:hypothetical protein
MIVFHVTKLSTNVLKLLIIHPPWVNVTSSVCYRRYRVVPQLRRLVTGFPLRRPGFDLRSVHVGFVVEEVSLGQVFSEYLGFPGQFLFHQLLNSHLSSGAGTVADVTKWTQSDPTPKIRKIVEIKWGSN